MQIVRRETVGGWSARVIDRKVGQYLVVEKRGEPTVIHFLAANIDQSMRKTDRIVQHIEASQ